MKKQTLWFFEMLLIVITLACDSQQQPSQKIKALTFDLKNVELLPGPFFHATELNKQSLLNYEPDRLLARFRTEAGLQAKAEPYHGWEDNTISGHSLGHYISGCALMYRTHSDTQFLNRVTYIVNELEVCQNAHGDGYIGAIPKGKDILIDQVSKGDIRSQSFDLNGLWAPFYNLHKMMAGLRDAYRLCEMPKALEVERKFADWIGTMVQPLDEEQVQKMLLCEHGGMNEVMVDLYADTGDDTYMHLSRIFHHKAVLDSLAGGKDILPNIHCNTQIPKLIGVARRFELTGDPRDYQAATFFWDRVVDHHSYVTGGNGNHEYFGEPDHLSNRLSDGTTETCNVYNMLKLSEHLFQWETSAKVADFYERALFNHILASQHPESGRVIYNLSLEMGGRKYYQNPLSFTCCVGTGMETHSKYGKNIFYHNENELFVSQFIPAQLDWQSKGYKIIQRTQFPEEQGTTLLLETDRPETFTIWIRYPYWARNGMEIKVNDENISFPQQPQSFVPIRRKWANGDKVLVKFPFDLHLVPMPDDDTRVAILFGPLVLAGDLGPEDDPDFAKPDYVPTLMTENRDPNTWLIPGESINEFVIKDIGRPRDFTLRPFYKTHDRRYSVYFDLYNEAAWQAKQSNYKADQDRKKRLEDATYDLFQPGEPTSEREHNFQGDKVTVEALKGKKMRGAERGGWLSFDMKVMMGQPMSLVLEYWGGFTGSKTFDILVDGANIATENISGKKDGHFIDVSYPIPDSLTVNVRKVTIRFQPHEGHRAGPFFGARTVLR